MACEKVGRLVLFAAILGVMSVVFVAVAFSTDYWVEVDVDRAALPTEELQLSLNSPDMARIYYSRHRGVLRECYPAKTTQPWGAAQNGDSEVCFYIDFNDPSGSTSTEYDRHTHFQRAMLITCVLGLVLIVVAFVLGIALFCLKHKLMAQVAGGACFLGALCVLISIVLLHADEYISANKDGHAGELVFQSVWGEDLRDNTSFDYGYSYVMAWMAVITATFQGILLLLAARAIDLMAGSDAASSEHSDVEVVIKKRAKERQPEEYVYDNYDSYSRGKSSHSSAVSVPVYPIGQTAMVQPLPAYPALSYVQAVPDPVYG